MSIKEQIVKTINNVLKNEAAARIIKNSSWLVGDKVFTMLIGVFVTAIVARYFGPENYGQFNYALSFVALFSTLSVLGLETLTVKAIVDREHDEGTILCTSLALRIIGGVVLTVLAVIIIRIMEPHEKHLHTLVLLMSLAMVFQSLEVIEYWIQAYQRAKISSIIRMGAYVIMAALKIVLVVSGGNLIHYALIHVLNVIIVGSALVIAYFIKREHKLKWKVNIGYGLSILSKSWYLILSGLMVTLYMQIDKVMLGFLMDTKTEVGIYSAAVQVAAMWYFVPLAFITSIKPVIMDKKKTDTNGYHKSVQLLYTMVAWMGIGFGIVILLFSKTIINILYGASYAQAANILTVSIWAGTFAMLGSARGSWLICEDLQRYSAIFTGTGALVNVVMNYILIPFWGGYGAAIATLFSQITVALIVPSFFKKTRISSVMMLRAFKLEGLLRKD